MHPLHNEQNILTPYSSQDICCLCLDALSSGISKTFDEMGFLGLIIMSFLFFLFESINNGVNNGETGQNRANSAK